MMSVILPVILSHHNSPACPDTETIIYNFPCILCRNECIDASSIGVFTRGRGALGTASADTVPGAGAAAAPDCNPARRHAAAFPSAPARPTRLLQEPNDRVSNSSISITKHYHLAIVPKRQRCA